MRASPPERYEAISQSLLDQAREELARNDLIQASEKIWGATAHAVKSVAQARGWNHRYHDHIREAAIFVAVERGEDLLQTRFALLNSLHDNFYEHQIRRDEVQVALRDAAVFTQAMRDARISGPPVDQSHLSPDEETEQARRLRVLTRMIRYPHEAEFGPEELENLPPVYPGP